MDRSRKVARGCTPKVMRKWKGLPCLALAASWLGFLVLGMFVIAVRAGNEEGRYAAELVPATGPSRTLRLVAIEDDWRCRFRSPEQDDEEQVLPIGEIARWGHPRQPVSGVVIYLGDGSRLCGDLLSLEQETCRLSSSLFGEMSFPLDRVRAIVLQLPVDAFVRRSFLREVLADSTLEDRMFLTNHDLLGGQLLAIEDGMVRWKVGNETRSLPMERIRAIQLLSMALKEEKPVGQWGTIGFRDGTVLRAQSGRTEQGTLQVKWTGDRILTTSIAEVIFLQPGDPLFDFLSDLSPEDSHFEPLFSIERSWQRDKNALGIPLQVDGKIYPKGVGMFSRGRLIYRLGGKYRRMEASIAMDDLSTGEGSAKFQIFLDGNPSGEGWVCRSEEPPHAISVDLSGVDRLELTIDYAEHGNVKDYADWLDGRLIPLR